MPNGNNNDNLLDGTSGGDTIYGLGGDDVINGLGGADSLVGGSGDDILNGGGGKDTLVGGAGDDELNGGGGNDELRGGAGNDVLSGGAGNDVLTGGDGSDAYVIKPNNGDDVINGFDANADTLDLSALVANLGGLIWNQIDANTIEITGGALGSGTITVNGAGPLSVATLQGATYPQLCFLEGTLISTPSGYRPIESIQPGDLVTTADGMAKPALWVHKQTISRRFATGDRRTPVMIRAGALGENLPVRDLVLSPNHAVFLDETLVQVGAMLNGSSVRLYNEATDTFAYFNIEFENHELIIAEGVVTESFLDSVNRSIFDNGKAFAEAYPARAEMRELDFPRAKSARQVPASVTATIREFAAQDNLQGAA